MAVTLATLLSEAQTRFQESTSTTNGIFTSAFVLSVVNEFYDERELDMELEGGPTDLTIAANTSTYALSSIASSAYAVQRIVTVDSDDEETGELPPRSVGDTYGYHIRGATIYFNGTVNSTSQDLRFWWLRTATRATATTDNADVHSGSERSVLLPLLLWKGYERAKLFAEAGVYEKQHNNAFNKMMKKVKQRTNPFNESWGIAEGYGPLTG